jgi:hypothetical protein
LRSEEDTLRSDPDVGRVMHALLAVGE